MKIISLNCRREGMDSGIHGWDARLPLIKQYIAENRPDIFGCQEAAVPQQLASLQQALAPDMVGFGDGRGKSLFGLAGDEATPIFYNPQTVRLLGQGTFSINPPGSRLFFSTTGVINRICTWGHFEEIATGKSFWVFNTHLACMIHNARVKQLEKLLAEIKNIVGETTHPLFLIGDFNEDVTESLRKRLHEFEDIRSIAISVLGPRATYVEWNKQDGDRIDHIFVKNSGNISVSYCKTVEDKLNARMSDHRALEAKLSL